MNAFIEKSGFGVDGHVLIKDLTTGKIVLDKHNAINFQNVAFAVANLLANKQSLTGGYFINKMAFGYGGTTIDGNGNVVYNTPRVDGANGGLYAASPGEVVGTNYEKEIDTYTIITAENQPYTDIAMTVVLDYNDPITAPEFDTSINFEQASDYVFDELALVTQSGDFLTHLIFHPIQKSQNRKLEITYTLRIRAGI